MSNRNIQIKDRVIIVELMNEGHSTASIKQIMFDRHDVDVSKRGIQKIVHKYKSEGIYGDRKRIGRPLKLSKRSQSFIRRLCLKNRRMSLTNLSRTYNMGSDLHVSRCTVNRILNKYGLRSHPAVCKPLVNDKQRKRRLQWARSRQQWDINKWSHVVFSDESMFRTHNHCHSQRIRRFQNERFSPICTKKIIQHGAQVHVWGCFSRFGVGILKRIQGKLNSEAYQTKILNDMNLVGHCIVFPLRTFIMQHDNAPCHRSASTVSYLTEQHIEVLDWPANSPDANPIENLWHFIKMKLNDLGPMNSDKMWKEIQNIWYNIPSALCRRLVDSMPRRVSSIIKMKGYPTKY